MKLLKHICILLLACTTSFTFAQDEDTVQFQAKVSKKKLGLKWLAKLIASSNFKFKQSTDYRLVEKTPRNAFKVELLNELFPDALFVYLAHQY